MNLEYNLSLPRLMDFFCDTGHQGFPLEEILEAEKRLGILLPQTYKDFLVAYGKDEVNTYYNSLMKPQEIYSSYEVIEEMLEEEWKPEFQEAVEKDQEAEYAENEYFQLWQMPMERWNTITDNYILIWYENQGVWSAGYRKKDLLDGVEDPPVYISTEDDYITYSKCSGNTEEFLVMMLREAAYGWHGGERFTSPAEIRQVLSDAGINKELLELPSGNGTCLAGDRLYFYTSGNYQELLFANHTRSEW